MPGRRKEDISLVKLESMVYEAQTLANSARAEARSFKAEIDRKIEALTTAYHQRELHAALDDKRERWDARRQRWQSIGAVAAKVAFYVALLILNWDRASVFFKAAFHKAESTQVPLMLDVNKRPRRHRRKKPPAPPPAPIVTPEIKEETNGENAGTQ